MTTLQLTAGSIAAIRRNAINRLADLIRADRTLTADDTREIADAVDQDPINTEYVGPGDQIYGYLLATSEMLGESGYDLMQSVELALGW